MTFLVQYRDGSGRTRRVSIGQHGAVTCDQARRKAKELLGRVAAGENPAEGKRQAAARGTVQAFSERFLEEHVSRKKPATMENYKLLLERFTLPKLGRHRLDAVTRADVESEVDWIMMLADADAR